MLQSKVYVSLFASVDFTTLNVHTLILMTLRHSLCAVKAMLLNLTHHVLILIMSKFMKYFVFHTVDCSMDVCIKWSQELRQ